MSMTLLARKTNRAPPPPPPIPVLLFLNGSSFDLSANVEDGQENIYSLVLLNGLVYAGTGEGGNLQESNDGQWYPPALTSYTSGSAFDATAGDALNNLYDVLSLVAFDDRMMLTGGDIGALQQLDAVTYARPVLLEFTGSAFTTAGNVTDNEPYIAALVEHNSKLYGCSGGTLVEMT